MKSKSLIFFGLLLIQWACKAPMIDANLPVDESIRLNQIGFYPDQQKIAIILNHEDAEDFVIWDLDKKDIAFEGNRPLRHFLAKILEWLISLNFPKRVSLSLC